MLRRKGVSTHIIAERIDAGETVKDLAADYALTPAEIEEAEQETGHRKPETGNRQRNGGGH